MEKATELFNVELSGEAVNHAIRYVREVFQKGAQEARRAKLDGEAQPIVISAMGANQSPIAVIEVKIAGQLVRRRFPDEAAVPVPQLFGQETDRHAPPPLRGRHLQNLQVLPGNRECRISAEFYLQKYAAKGSLNARTFAKPIRQETGGEDWLRSGFDAGPETGTSTHGLEESRMPENLP
jgi:hypothetical protein